MDTLDKLLDSKIIAIARGVSAEDLIMASKALYSGGVRAFEVAFEQGAEEKRTAECIAGLLNELPSDAAVGAGTVLSPKQAEAAHEAGASFIISPNTSEAVIARTKELGMVSVPGAMTPTEILKAYELGADIVKLFPAGVLGIEYFKAVRAPLSGIPLAAVAGITPENIALFEAAGAAAYGISSSLYLKNAIRERRFDAMTEAAKRFFDAMKA